MSRFHLLENEHESTVYCRSDRAWWARWCALRLAHEKRYLLGVELHGRINGVTEEDAHALMRAAHDICPYSNATRRNIEVHLFAETGAVA